MVGRAYYSLFEDGKRIHNGRYSGMTKTGLAEMLNRIHTEPNRLDHFSVGFENDSKPFATAHEWLSDWMTRKQGMAYDITPLRFSVTSLSTDIGDLLATHGEIECIEVRGISEMVFEIKDSASAERVYAEVFEMLEEFTRKG